MGKYEAVNWNARLPPALRSKLNKLARRATSYAKSIEMPAYPVDLGICNNLKLNDAEER